MIGSFHGAPTCLGDCGEVYNFKVPEPSALVVDPAVSSCLVEVRIRAHKLNEFSLLSLNSALALIRFRD